MLAAFVTKSFMLIIDSHYLHCCIQVPRKVYTSGFTLEKLLGSSFSFSAQW